VKVLTDTKRCEKIRKGERVMKRCEKMRKGERVMKRCEKMRKGERVMKRCGKGVRVPGKADAREGYLRIKVF
jgi:hypothetical protein